MDEASRALECRRNIVSALLHSQMIGVGSGGGSVQVYLRHFLISGSMRVTCGKRESDRGPRKRHRASRQHDPRRPAANLPAVRELPVRGGFHRWGSGERHSWFPVTLKQETFDTSHTFQRGTKVSWSILRVVMKLTAPSTFSTCLQRGPRLCPHNRPTHHSIAVGLPPTPPFSVLAVGSHRPPAIVSAPS